LLHEFSNVATCTVANPLGYSFGDLESRVLGRSQCIRALLACAANET
jgi:hypothetical protein